MSRTSKTLLKLIMLVVAIYLIVVAIPIAQKVFQGLISAAGPTSPLPGITPTTELGVGDSYGGTSTPTAAFPTLTPESSSSITVTLTSEPGGPTETLSLPPTSTATTAQSNPTSIAASSEDTTYTVLLPLLGLSYPYHIQNGTPVFIQNFAHADAGCNWLSVAGQVFDASGAPVKNLQVSISGSLSGSPVNLLGVTGQADQYGPGGYEIQLGSQAVTSTDTLFIRLLDGNGNPISDQIPFNTSASCDQNVVLINFTP